MTGPRNPVQELTEAGHALRDDTLHLGPSLSGPLSALMYAAAQRLATHLPGWQGADDTETLVANLYGPELAVAREVLRQAGTLGGPA